MVLYGDTISNIEINGLVNFHQNNEKPATMTVWPLRSQFGIVELDKADNVMGFKEKPKLDKWINIGYFYFKQEMKELIQKYDSFAEFLRILAEKGLLNAYKHNGIHITVNTIKELADAEKNIERI
jgi:glucose-1-phosphate cytidylyltransferase